MPSNELLKEAERVMVVCNACRYCEGFCAVFPAMELRRIFAEQDLKYLSNLCHNCRSCYYACQYAPPHEFSLNVPRTMAELRMQTYQEFTWPKSLLSLFRHNGLAVALITAFSVAIVMLLTFALQDPSAIFSVHLGENAFYKVIPYELMVVVFSALGIYVLAALTMGLVNFSRATGGKLADLGEPQANARALRDALQLKYLDGGGHGCNYPDEKFSYIRRWFHHSVFYGFLLCLASTTLAFFYHHVMHWTAPYALGSLPVILGTLGGISLLVGTGGLLYLKQRMDTEPAAPNAFSMDIGFLILLLLTSLTGLLVLIVRDTPAMGTMLSLHLGFVVAFFLTIPYGKFVHAIYRYAALVRNATEQIREGK